MTLPDDFWARDMEDEPCRECGARPSKHQGHGAYVCRACYEAWWCPKCHHMLKTTNPDGHVCVESKPVSAMDPVRERLDYENVGRRALTQQPTPYVGRVVLYGHIARYTARYGAAIEVKDPMIACAAIITQVGQEVVRLRVFLPNGEDLDRENALYSSALKDGCWTEVREP